MQKILRTLSIIIIAGIAIYLTSGSNNTAQSEPVQTQKSPSLLDKAEKTIISQTKCPVMGGHIDEDMYVDVMDKRIYICCMACEDAIKTEPERYIKKIQARGEVVQSLK